MNGREPAVRPLLEREWGQASDLVWRVFSQFEAPDYPPEGIQAFRQFVDPHALGELARRGKLRLWGCFHGPTLVGVGAVRGGGHISLLFVESAWHRKGCGGALLNEMLRWCRRGGAAQATVNAAPPAVGFYKKMGFVPQGEEQVADGIRFTPMLRRLEGAQERGKAW